MKSNRHVADTVASKRGRPSKLDRIARLTEFQRDRLEAEIGRPLRELTATELEALIKHVARERGWRDLCS